MTASLLKLEEKTWDHVVQKALESYGIASHYSTEDYPVLVDGEPLRAAFAVVARAAVAAALNKLAAGELGRMPEAVAELLTELASETDLTVCEMEDGA